MDSTPKETVVANVAQKVKGATVINEEMYVFVKKEPETEGIYEHFRRYKHIQADGGYWFERKDEKEIAEICKQTKALTCQLKTLAIPVSFDKYKRFNTLDYYEDKLIENEERARAILVQSKVIESKNTPLTEYHYGQLSMISGGKEIAEEYQKIKKGLLRVKNQENIASIKSANKTTLERSLKIQFIANQSPNYLTQKAPDAPVLLQIMKGSEYAPFLRKGIVGQLVGAGGIGKTHWLTQLAFSVTTGLPFFEIYRVNEKGNVFMGLGENANDDIHRLLHKHSKNLTDAQKDTVSQKLAVMSFVGQSASFIDNDGEPTDMYNAFIEELKSSEPEDGWTLIILDPISRFFGADAEKDNAAATRFIALLERIVLELRGKPTLLFGHHMSKSGLTNTSTDQTASRGSSAITDGVRWQANLDKVELEETESKEQGGEKYDKNKVRFRVVKSNFTAIPEPQILYKDGANGCLSATPSIAGGSSGRKISDLK